MSPTSRPRRCATTLAALTTLPLLAGAAPALAATAPDRALAVADRGSLHHIAEAIGAHEAYDAGVTGKGVDVALIDTGVTEVPGLDTGNVLHGPDLSFDSQLPELTHRDAYGHGTHMASIIAGRDLPGEPASYKDPSRFSGIAPDARIVSVKVGASDGAVDVSQVIAAVDWVVENRERGDLDIRVLALAYGTDGTQDPAVDPLAYAVQNAREHGILVVAAGGNDGRHTRLLANPATHPQVLAVGAADTAGTASVRDDVVPEWASRGTAQRHVDLVAPGVSVMGLRVPGGVADEAFPGARVGDRLFRGTGTSQAAAVTAGAAALVLQQHPHLTPDQVKDQLVRTAQALSGSSTLSGRGLVDVGSAVAARPSRRPSGPSIGTGTGSLDRARGTIRVNDGVSDLVGEIDIFGNPWDGKAWAVATAGLTAWNGGDWLGVGWTGDGWEGRTWTGRTWTGRTWTGRTWTSDDWSGRTWTGRTWTGGDWSGRTWTGRTWTGRTWTSGTWSGQSAG